MKANVIGTWVETRTPEGRLVQGVVVNMFNNGKVRVIPKLAVIDNGARKVHVGARGFNVTWSRCESIEYPY